jgi:hypothetical protein
LSCISSHPGAVKVAGFTDLTLIPAGAHLFEALNKSDLPRDAYLSVQGIYAG